MIYTPEFKKYKDAVFADFLEKQKNADGGWLTHPTRAQIRKELIQRVDGGLPGADQQLLRRWLRADLSKTDMETALRRKDANGFKTLEQLFSNTSMNSAEDNIEVIALLINYELRPASKFKSSWQDDAKLLPPDGGSVVGIEEPELVEAPLAPIPHPPHNPMPPDGGSVVGIEEPDLIEAPVTPIPHPPQHPIQANTSKWWYFAAMGLVVVCALVWYVTRTSCMYWNNYRYVATSCSIPRLDTAYVPLDEAKLRGFRRIIRTDTLTGYAREHYWYAHVGRRYEVFTASGTHPIYTEKKLKRVTDFVINYCRNPANPH